MTKKKLMPLQWSEVPKLSEIVTIWQFCKNKIKNKLDWNLLKTWEQ